MKCHESSKWKTVGIEFKSDKRKLARDAKILPFTIDVDTSIIEYA